MQNYQVPNMAQQAGNALDQYRMTQGAMIGAMPGQTNSPYLGNTGPAGGPVAGRQGGWDSFRPPQQPMHYGMPQGNPWGQIPGFGQGGNPYMGYGNGVMAGSQSPWTRMGPFGPGGQGASPMIGGSQYPSPYGWGGMGGYGMQPTFNNMGYQRFGFG